MAATSVLSALLLSVQVVGKKRDGVSSVSSEQRRFAVGVPRTAI